MFWTSVPIHTELPLNITDFRLTERTQHFFSFLDIFANLILHQ